ncbi:uncharacterized protein DS421_11g345940 [Arachis hypogaea]|nr:uncharacterized protein DS421_11g345940 [Arachis hypogaea]
MSRMGYLTAFLPITTSHNHSSVSLQKSLSFFFLFRPEMLVSEVVYCGGAARSL